MAEGPIIEYGDLIGDDGTFNDLSNNIKTLEKELLDLAKTMQKTFSSLKPNDTDGIQKASKEIEELEKTQKNLIKVEKAMQTAKKKTIDLTNEELIQREKQKIANRERVQRAKQLAIIQKEEKNNIASIRAQLALTTIEWKKLTKEELENTKEGRKLVKNKKDLTKQLKKLEEATDDHRRSVGKYSKGLKGLRKTFIRLFVGRTIIEGVARLGSALADIVTEGAATNDKFATLVETFGRAKEFLIGLATSFLNFIAGPLSSLVNTFLFVADSIGKASTEGSILGNVFSFIGSVFTGVIDIINKLPAIFGGVVAAARDFGTTTVNIFTRMRLQLEIIFAQINKANPFSKQSSKQIEANIKRIAAEQKRLASESIGVQAAFRKGYDDVIKAQEEFNKQQSAGLDTQKESSEQAESREKAIARQNALLEKQQTLLIQISVNEGARLKAIEEVNKKLLDAEIANIKDRETQLNALEEQRFASEQVQRDAQFKQLKIQIEAQEKALLEVFKADSDVVKAFRKNSAKDLEAFRTANNNLEVEQLKKHQENLLRIRKEFALKTGEIQAIDVQRDALDKQSALLDEEVALVEEANEKKKKSNQDLINDIADSADKVGAIIVDLFEKQADMSEQRVDEQEENLSRARDRAAKGLKTNLAFEEQELVKRQAENQRRQKEAEQAARLLTLFNLVSAYAGSGDKNALARGFVDFSLLTALGAGLYEGSEDIGKTSNPLDSKGGRLYKLHDNERVVPKYLNEQLAGMSNEDMTHNAILGSRMGDYFPAQTPLLTNPYQAQKEAFKQGVKQTDSNSNEMIKELKAIKTHLSKQPNVGIMIEEVYDNVYAMIKKESKSNLTKISKKFLRAKK